MENRSKIETLQKIANQLRILSVRSTTAAGSGHPTSCCSAADLVAALFFEKMRLNPKNPHQRNNDRFILSKGHAAPLLYSVWAELGHFPEEELDRLRTLHSPLEGHPTPRLDFVDVATGSLGQGLSDGLGMALYSQIEELAFQTYVLLGDGEMAEGSVWEAASLAGTRRCNLLTAVLDMNRFGQSQETAFGHHAEIYRARFEAFGWKAIVIDGHRMDEILSAYDQVGKDPRPLAIIAKTIKGKGISIAEDHPDWHGKALKKDQAEQAIRELSTNAMSGRSIQIKMPPDPKGKAATPTPIDATNHYDSNKKVATRKAFGNALARLGETDTRIYAFDGDVENSTYTQEFGKKFPKRFIEAYIAEQNMIGMAAGMSALGAIPFASTFAAFFTRAADQIRMAAVSSANLKLVGTHVGVSIGEDGPSQMGLEDLALMRTLPGSVVFSPCDAVSTEKLVNQMVEHQGITYLRAGRPESPVIYSESEKFEVGGIKILKQSPDDQVTVIATGITVFEALKAAEELAKQQIHITVLDAYCIKPLPAQSILAAAKSTGNQVITVEDHYPAGGLGDAVAGELSQFGVRVFKLAVNELPHSGTQKELLEKYQIDSTAIVNQVQVIIKTVKSSQAA